MQQARKSTNSTPVVDVPIHTVRSLPSRRTRTHAEQSSRDRWIIFTLMLIGAALRFDFLLASEFVVDADEAIVGLMAKHMAAGGPIPVFYYGQHYMGSLEPLLISLIYRCFGVSAVGLRVVPTLFALALIPLMYRLGVALGSRRAGLVAALLCAVPPVGLVVWSTKARGGFIELVYIGAYSLLLTVRWCRAERLSMLTTLSIGLVLGFGWWTNNQIIFFMLPIAAVMMLRTLTGRRPFIAKLFFGFGHATAGALGFIAGGLPFWLYNLQNNFVSFQMFHGTEKQDVLAHVEGLFSVALPILLGAKRFWESTDIFPGSTAVAYGLYGCVLVIATVLSLRQLVTALRLQLAPEPPTMLFLLFFATTLGVFAVSSFGHLIQAPRYLLPGYVALFVLSGVVVDRVAQLSPLLGNALLCGLLALNVASAYAGGRAVPGEPIVYGYERVSRDHSELEQWLGDNHISFVRTNYWIGYRLAFDTKEAVRFLVYREPRQSRIESYREDGKSIPEYDLPLVLTPTQGNIVEAGLQVLGYRYEKAVLSGYSVIWHIARSEAKLAHIRPNRFALAADQHQDLTPNLVDSDRQTRWGTGLHQTPGMQIRVQFPEATALRGIAIDLGEWEQDYPRGFIINARQPDGGIVTLMNEAQYFAARYYLDGDPVMTMSFPPQPVSALALNEMGSDGIFDWSIAELSLYE